MARRRKVFQRRKPTTAPQVSPKWNIPMDEGLMFVANIGMTGIFVLCKLLKPTRNPRLEAPDGYNVLKEIRFNDRDLSCPQGYLLVTGEFARHCPFYADCRQYYPVVRTKEAMQAVVDQTKNINAFGDRAWKKFVTEELYTPMVMDEEKKKEKEMSGPESAPTKKPEPESAPIKRLVIRMPPKKPAPTPTDSTGTGKEKWEPEKEVIPKFPHVAGSGSSKDPGPLLTASPRTKMQGRVLTTAEREAKRLRDHNKPPKQ